MLEVEKAIIELRESYQTSYALPISSGSERHANKEENGNAFRKEAMRENEQKKEQKR